MNNWPEAVWIVKKLQKNFDFTQEISKYETKLYDLNTRINTLIDRVELDEKNLNNKIVTFVASATPDKTNCGKGAIWFITKN